MRVLHFELVSPHPPEECAQLLSEALAAQTVRLRQFPHLGETTTSGNVNGNALTLWRAKPNQMEKRPQGNLKARLCPAANGSIIECEITVGSAALGPLLGVLFGLWTLVYVAMVLGALNLIPSTPPNPSLDASGVLAVVLTLLALPVMVVSCVKWMKRGVIRDGEFLTRLLSDALKAVPRSSEKIPDH